MSNPKPHEHTYYLISWSVVLINILTYSFIAVKTERSTLGYVTQDSDYVHVASAYAATQDSNHCHTGQQQPGLARRLPDTDGAKVLPTSDQVGFYLASTHQMAPRHTSDWTGLLLIYVVRNVPEMQVALSVESRAKSGQAHVKPTVSGIHRLLQPPFLCRHADGFPSHCNIQRLSQLWQDHFIACDIKISVAVRCGRNIGSKIDIIMTF